MCDPFCCSLNSNSSPLVHVSDVLFSASSHGTRSRLSSLHIKSVHCIYGMWATCSLLHHYERFCGSVRQISLSNPEPHLSKRVNLSGIVFSSESPSTMNVRDPFLVDSLGCCTILSASSSCKILESSSIVLLLYSETIYAKRHPHPRYGASSKTLSQRSTWVFPSRPYASIGPLYFTTVAKPLVSCLYGSSCCPNESLSMFWGSN